MTNDQRISDIIERWDTKQIDGQIPSVSGKKLINEIKCSFLKFQNKNTQRNQQFICEGL